jgi:hypothetical protein
MWLYKGKPFTEEDVGDFVAFVYRITNRVDGRAYIGKKNFFKRVTRAPLKGKKRKRRSLKQSDWMEYYGSNDELNKDVEKYGPANFDREILRLCETKGESTYYEAKLQFECDAIISDRYYNTWIICKVTKNHLPKQKS